MVNNEEITIYLSIAGISASLVSVISAILITKIIDHVSQLRLDKKEIDSRLYGYSDHIKSIIETIPNLENFAK